MNVSLGDIYTHYIRPWIRAKQDLLARKAVNTEKRHEIYKKSQVRDRQLVSLFINIAFLFNQRVF